MVFHRILGYLTPKMGNKNYYKGRGVRSTGHASSINRWIMDPKKALTIHVPANFHSDTPSELKPYVSRHCFPLTKEEVNAKKDEKKQRRLNTLMATQKK
ncbi:hypothetical protein RB653_005404 [Dictyostelium firmibasis]|uniref:Uncharacterized protein n=1 Tax=Dictyostelium firmibasis TaxID=79012 RepID=A0AAN7U7W5_9MYCE